MEIVDFSEKTFGEIPKQDNPAYMTKKEWDAAGENGCLLITKQEEQKPPYKNCGRLCVFKIEPVENPDEQESVSYLGLFWELEHAKSFANSFCKNDQYIIDKMNDMCTESLSPDNFINWESVKDGLKLVRRQLR